MEQVTIPYYNCYKPIQYFTIIKKCRDGHTPALHLSHFCRRTEFSTMLWCHLKNKIPLPGHLPVIILMWRICHHNCSTIKIYYYKNASSTAELNHTFVHFFFFGSICTVQRISIYITYSYRQTTKCYYFLHWSSLWSSYVEMLHSSAAAATPRSWATLIATWPTRQRQTH